jgi:hypothetical protein
VKSEEDCGQVKDDRWKSGGWNNQNTDCGTRYSSIFTFLFDIYYCIMHIDGIIPYVFSIMFFIVLLAVFTS